MRVAVHPVQMVMGFIIWAVWFVAIYGGLSVACDLAPPSIWLGHMTWINAVLLGVTLFTTLFLLALAYRCWRARPDTDNHRFVVWISFAGYVGAAVATFAVGLPILGLPPCL
jgi:hypothetical protein